ncbi:MAG: molecular chaperone SurA [Candidatus Methylopumilus sp.]|nr:molecular chaperone SurA [Candidatus Methylopumilus sp.]
MNNLVLRRLSFCLVLLVLLTARLIYANDDVQKIDRIVALVEQSVITEKELNDRIKTLINQLNKQKIEIPPTDVLQKQMIERMVLEKLQISFAQQTGLKVEDALLDKTIERIAEQNKLDLAEFKKALASEGLSYRRFREDLRNEILLSRLKEREVDSKLNITEAEVENYLSLQSKEQQSDEYNLSHILIRTPEDASPNKLAELKRKADDAFNQIKSGKDFAQVSAALSDAPNALEGGQLGWKNITQLPSLFADAVRNLKPGQTTEILRSANGFHIIKLNERRGGSSPLVITQSHLRHILIKVNEVTSEKEAKQRMEIIRERAEHGEDFAELAKQYSEDSSASNGGDLGWVNPNENLPELDRAMEKLAIAEISPIIKSQFGIHIIQVTERRQQDMSKEAAKLKARQEIRARKSDEAYQDWIRELRDKAFVEIRLEDKF